LLVPAARTYELLDRAFPGCTLADAAPLLHELRAIKSPEDIAGLRIACEVAHLGLAAFSEHFHEERSEAEVAAAVEYAICAQGTGYQPAGGGAPVRRVRAWAQLMTGPASAMAYTPFPASTSRTIQAGDLGVLELATVADGYWSDLTRTRVASGQPSERQRLAHTAIVEAHRAAMRAMRPGVTGREVDDAARRVIMQAGFGPYFLHHTGHGLGFRYHEPLPLLAPAGERALAAGMVTSLEPGIYIPGWGGLRIEDNVVITPSGAEYLSSFDPHLG
jgi:Xaa-Pro aminopeptidase